MPDSKPDLKADETLLHDAVREAGALALTFFGRDIKIWQKTDQQPVTQADIEVNNLLSEKLHRPRPSYGWLSEESEDDIARLQKNFVWVIDPIDGTKAFMQGLDEFTICAALVEKNRPILACIFNPVRGEFYHAQKGGGAYKNNQPIKISGQTEIKNGFRLCARENILAKAKAGDWPQIIIENPNSTAYRLARVAEGFYDAMVTHKANDWDIAAGDLLMHEAGGALLNANGTPITYNQPDVTHGAVLAAHPALCPLLAKRMGGLMVGF